MVSHNIYFTTHKSRFVKICCPHLFDKGEFTTELQLNVECFKVALQTTIMLN